MGSTVILLFEAIARAGMTERARRDATVRLGQSLGCLAMSWRPTGGRIATRAALRQPRRMLARAREFFARRGVLEVETPILSAAAVSDPQIESLATQIAG